MGPTPGAYRISINPAQLRNLNAPSTPTYRNFTIRGIEDRDVINGLNFTTKAQPRMPASPAEAAEVEVNGGRLPMFALRNARALVSKLFLFHTLSCG